VPRLGLDVLHAELTPSARWSLLASLCGPASARCGIPEYANAFHRNKRSPGDHLVKDREQTINMRLIVHDFDHDRQVG
jgi:hypothetical protein